MALEPAGISLQAEGFNKYIRQLKAIDKAQDNVFDVDSKKLDSAFTKVEKSSASFGSSLDIGISKGVKGFGSLGAAATTGFGAVVIGAGAAAAAIGAVGVAVVDVAADTNQATNQIAASLGISQDAAKGYSDELQNIFVANPQAEFTEIAEAIALTERALDGLTGDQLEDVANTALLIEKQFGQDLAKTVGATEQLIEQFGLSSQEATDLLTAGLQQIPAEDLIDTVGEYSNLFAQAGFSASEFFSVLQTGVAGGVLGTDRIADATKEFQIRFLEGNKSLKDSFSVLGLSFDQLTQDVSAGQRTIADVFGLVVDRAGEIDLTVASNRAAIAGLGTQFEDLGATAVAALDPDAIGFEDVAGAADSLNARFNNIGDALTSVQRGALVALAPIGQAILELANDIVPRIRAGFEAVRPSIEAFAARVVPAVQFAGEAFGRLVQSLGGASSGASTLESVLSGIAFVIEGVAGGIEILARTTESLRQVFAFARAGAAAFGSLVSDVFNTAIKSAGALGKAFARLINLDFAGALEAAGEFEVISLDDINESLDKAGQAAIDTFKDIAIPPVEVPVEIKPTDDAGASATGISDQDLSAPFDNQSNAIQGAVQNLDAYQSALQQAEDLQRSFAQSAEDNALKLARANEDIARDQAKQVADLQDKQAKDRDKLLRDQQKQLDEFEADRRKQISKAEADIQKERQKAADQRKKDQQKLQRELQRAQEQFNLSQLQSERRFSLSERRLRAEGDILAIQQLREDRELERQEEKENFDQGQKEREQSGLEQIRDQEKVSDERLKELKTSLEDQRAELLRSFDEQVETQRQAQVEAQELQKQQFAEQAAERQIQLQREEEDRRLSQQRQLEDLGRSFSEQEGITEEGTAAVANQLEEVFGIDGTADSIISGFTEKTESEFVELFKNLENIIKEAEMAIEPTSLDQPSRPQPQPARLGGIPEFQDGGIVPGPTGSPQIVQAHGGETILPTHQRSFIMPAPVIPSQNLNVNMSGGFNITGDGQADEAILQAATQEMTDNFRIAVQRLARRN